LNPGNPDSLYLLVRGCRPLLPFFFNLLSKGGRSIYFKNYQEEHKEYLKELTRKWYIKNKEAIKERNLKYYQAHREACQARRKLWIIKNRERIRKYNREYKRKHKIRS